VNVCGTSEEQAEVTCVNPGHDRPGGEVVAGAIDVTERPPLRFELSDRCGYEATFDYSSD